MKKILFILLIAPFLLATQCDDDENSGFETTYMLENNTSVDLYLLRPENRFLKIQSQSSETIGSELNSITEPVSPEEALVIESIQLFERVDEDFILIYEQDPLKNNAWIFMETSINRFVYTLVINDIQLP
ncbi:MAG: hypothetical protein WBV45_07520 [Lutimonas sp.]